MSMPQHMEALDKANRVRLGRAQVRRDLVARKITLADVLAHPDVQSARLGYVLSWQWRWGGKRVKNLLSALRISETRKVDELTDRQKGLVVAACARRRMAA